MARNDNIANFTSLLANFMKAKNSGQDTSQYFSQLQDVYKTMQGGLGLMQQANELQFQQQQWPTLQKQAEANVMKTTEEAKGLELDRTTKEAVNKWYQDTYNKPPGSDELEEVYQKVREQRIKNAVAAATHQATVKAGGYGAKAGAEAAQSQAIIEEQPSLTGKNISSNVYDRAVNTEKFRQGAYKEEAIVPRLANQATMSGIVKDLTGDGKTQPTSQFLLGEIGNIAKAISDIDKAGTTSDITDSDWYKSLDEGTKKSFLVIQAMTGSNRVLTADDKLAAKRELIEHRDMLAKIGQNIYPELEWPSIEGATTPTKKQAGGEISGEAMSDFQTSITPQEQQSFDSLSAGLIRDGVAKNNQELVEIFKSPSMRSVLNNEPYNIPDSTIESYIASISNAKEPAPSSPQMQQPTGKWEYRPVDIDANDEFTLENSIRTLSNQYGVEPEMVLAIMKAESDLGRNTFNKISQQKRGDQSMGAGIMQISAGTAKDMFGLSPEDLKDYNKNINAGIAYLGKLVERGATTPDEFLNGYIAGENDVKNDVESLIKNKKIKYDLKEYQNYRRNVNAAYNLYKSNPEEYIKGIRILLNGILKLQKPRKIQNPSNR